MKHFLLSIICLITFSSAVAQSVGYTYKALAAEGCSVKYSALWQDGQPYIVVVVSSDRLVFNDTPIMMMRLFNGELIKSEGKAVNTTTSQGGRIIGKVVVPDTELQVTAQFPITKQQVDMLYNGVAKIRITTLPLTHERTFKRDKIGEKLYYFFQEGAQSEDDF